MKNTNKISKSKVDFDEGNERQKTVWVYENKIN